MIRTEIRNLVEKSIKAFQKEGVLPVFEIPEIIIDHPENKNYGDYSTNVAFALSKILKKSPLELSDLICKKIPGMESNCTAGFINFKVPKEYLQKQVEIILKEGQSFGKLRTGRGQKVNVEFISANPTGPLTLGNGRGGFCGDVLANVLGKADFKVGREYYINDAGEQVRKLGHSVLGDNEAVYQGPYVEDLKKRVKGENVQRVGEDAAKIILNEMIKPSVEKMGIKFDIWFSEKNLHEKKEIDKVLEFLKKKGLTYENEGALWFKSTEFGDDKDRVLIKADGDKTYLASDIAYLKNKFERGFGKLIFYWGADHHGYVERLKDAAFALGYKKEQVEIILMQLVKLFQEGKEVRMSKRTGIYVTMDELIDEVGLDATRFFFLSRAANSHLDFDMDLAKEKSDKNPVYYAQYAHARICSILEKSGNKRKGDFKLLSHSSELKLIKELIRFPEIIEDTSKDYQLQRIPQYSLDLAAAFHAFYRDCQVINDDKNLEAVRISLVLAVKIVLENVFDLMGISSPKKM
jgi:arginyl-tRNA synthetase